MNPAQGFRNQVGKTTQGWLLLQTNDFSPLCPENSENFQKKKS
jgi:hypothetical protein